MKTKTSLRAGPATGNIHWGDYANQDQHQSGPGDRRWPLSKLWRSNPISRPVPLTATAI